MKYKIFALFLLIFFGTFLGGVLFSSPSGNNPAYASRNTCKEVYDSDKLSVKCIGKEYAIVASLIVEPCDTSPVAHEHTYSVRNEWGIMDILKQRIPLKTELDEFSCKSIIESELHGILSRNVTLTPSVSTYGTPDSPLIVSADLVKNPYTTTKRHCIYVTGYHIEISYDGIPIIQDRLLHGGSHHSVILDADKCKECEGTLSIPRPVP